MSLTLYFHPLSSFCWKSLVALYETGIPFNPHLVNLGDPESKAQFLKIWPLGQFPVLRDDAKQRTIPQSSAIFDYLAIADPKAKTIFPSDALELMEARRWNDFFDAYVQVPMQKVVGDCLRAKEVRDPYGVAEAHEMLKKAYDILESHLESLVWCAGDSFSIADCAACPALFYGNKVEPIGAARPILNAYLMRLERRPSFERVLKEAEPWMKYFPYPAENS